MTQYMRALVEKSESESGPIRFVASTEKVGRDGLIIAADGWQLDNYRNNPVVLWGHDYAGSRLPIGRADVEVEGKRLLADVTFDLADPFAAEVDRKYRTGFLSAVSVGWDTQEMSPNPDPAGASRVTKAELLDISAVPVPGDPHALKERQARGYANLHAALSDILIDTTTAPDEAVWIGTATSMVRLFCADANDSDSDRESTYKRLARAYEKCGKTPPELRSIADVSALGASELQGLFLEGEPAIVPEYFTEQRAGAVLNARNRNDLQEAARLIQNVIERSVSPEPETETGPLTEHDDTLERLHAAIIGATNG